MPSATSSRLSGRALEASMAARGWPTDSSPMPLERRPALGASGRRGRPGRPTSPASDQLDHPLLAQPLDVHGRRARRSGRCAGPAGPGSRCWCSRCRSPPPGAPAGSPHDGQIGGELPAGRGGAWAAPGPSRTGPTTSGMTSPALRTTTRSPGPHVLQPHLVLVVQGGQADGGPPDEDRLQDGEGGGPPGPPDRHLDVRAAWWCAPRAGT